MKAPSAVLGLFFVASSLVAAPDLPPPQDTVALVAWFSAQGDRREGSPGEKRVFEALKTWFTPQTVLEEDGFEGLEGEHSFSQRLWFRVQGRAPGELVVVVPTDGTNHRGLAWAVTWAWDALAIPPSVSLTFLFTGAERGTGTAAGMGSRAFLQDFYPTVPAAALYLDAKDASEVELTTESGLYPSPLWMVRGLTETFSQVGLDPQLTGTAPSLFRLDIPERRNALAPWFDRSVPALGVASGPGTATVVRALETFVGTMQDGMPGLWDRHYLVFDFGTWKFFWGQATYLAILLGIIAVVVFGYALAGRRFRGSLRVLFKGLWQLPVLFAFVFLFLWAGTGLATAFQESRGDPDFWKTSPLLVGSFKALVAVSLYLLLFLPFGRSPLHRNADFYGQAALVWLGIMVLATATLELSFSFYFVWAMVWCAVLVVVPWRPVRFVALILGPVWLFKAAWDVMGPSPDLTLSQWALKSPIAGNFVLAVLLFPFLLQLNAWHYTTRVRGNADHRLRSALQLGLAGVSTLVMGLLVLRSEPSEPLAEKQLVTTWDLRSNPGSHPWKTSVSRTAFLDRTVWTIRFSGEIDPETLDLNLRADGPLTVFDCTFPVSLDAEGEQARIVVGRQPPLPLVLRVTLPATTRAHLDVKADFVRPTAVKLIDVVELIP